MSLPLLPTEENFIVEPESVPFWGYKARVKGNLAYEI